MVCIILQQGLFAAKQAKAAGFAENSHPRALVEHEDMMGGSGPNPE
jgi:hypothetical protein